MDFKQTTEALDKSTLFSGWARADLARLIPHLSLRTFEPGSMLCLSGETADTVFILVEGTAGVHSNSDGRSDTSGLDATAGLADQVLTPGGPHDCAGQEAAFGATTYLHSVEAVQAVVALTVPSGALLAAAPEKWLQSSVPHLSLINRLAGGRLDIANSDAGTNSQAILQPRPPARVRSVTKTLAEFLRKDSPWLLTLIIPALVLLLTDPPSWLSTQLPQLLVADPLSWSQRHFAAILMATLVMWVFHLVPIYVGALFGLLASLILEVAPASTILSGFSSSSFFMAMSILGFAFILKESGLPYRTALLLLRQGAGKPFWANLGMIGTGLLLTPAMPSTTARTLLMCPLLTDMSEALGQKRGGRGATQLTISMFAGTTFFYPLFITSSSLNFILYGLLPDQLQQEFHWMHWLVAAIPAGVILLILCLVVASFMYRGSTAERPPAMEQLDQQISLLGPLRKSYKEWIALSGLVLLMGAIATSSLHRIAPAWVALGIFYILLSIGVLRETDMKRGIDWSFLLFVGAVVGLVATTTELGIGTMLAGALEPLLALTDGSAARMTAVIIISILMLRIFLPFNAAGVLAASVFLPLASHAGYNEWLVVFVILMMADCWLFSYQSIPLQVLIEQQRDPNDGSLIFDLARFVRFNRISVVFRIIAIYGAFPYFYSVGIL